MKLRKRINAAILAASMVITMFPVSSPFTTMAKAEEIEKVGEFTEDASKDIQILTENEEETKDGIEILNDTSEENKEIIISDMTIADTYYSVNGKFPIYVEYIAETLTDAQRRTLQLKVTREDGTTVCEISSNSYQNSFFMQECNDIKKGDNNSLTFSITDADGKEIITKTKTVKFEDKDSDSWASYAYLPTDKRNYSLQLYTTIEEVLTADSIDAVYLIDKDDKVAAGTIDSVYVSRGNNDPRYQEIFQNNIYFSDWKYIYINADLYRTRKLENKEILYAACVIGGKRYDLKDITVTVTEQPYMISIYNNSSNYPGEEKASIIQVHGYHIDFSKLSVVLKDQITGEIAGSSVSSMIKLTDTESAFYTIKWNENYQDIKEGYYNIEYNYSDNEKELIAERENRVYIRKSSENIIWNPKGDVIEYYNKQIPIDSEIYCEIWDQEKEKETAVCCVSRSGIKVNNEHLITIPLKETFEREQTYYIYITYKDEESKEVTVYDDVYIYPNKKIESGKPGEPSSDYIIYSYMFSNQFYLSNNEKPEFSARLYCNDTKKLKTTCSASISNNTEVVGNIELTLNDKETLVYQGAYDKALKPGRYQLSFTPDGNNRLTYLFFVEDSEHLSVNYQSNNIHYGEIELHFGASNIADWYCNEENQKKIKVKILDIQRQEIGSYEFSKDFTIRKWGDYLIYLQFNDTIKKELENLYFCYVYVYYNEEDIAISFERNYDLSIKSLYEYNVDYARYRYSESSSHIRMDYRTYNDAWNKGKYTYDRVYGSESAFPAIIKITDWYNLKTIKEITVPNSGYKFTEKDLEGLSPTKVYAFYLTGADGCARKDSGYLDITYGDQFFTTFSKVYPMSGDFDIVFEFTNKSKGINNWDNYLVCFANVFEQIVPKLNDNPGYKEYYVLRADAHGWSATGENKTLEGNEVTYEYDWEWNQFLTMIKDSKITMNIKRTGNDFTVDAKIKGADAKDYTYKTKFTTAADKDITIFFTNENADVSILSFTDNTNKKPEISDDNNMGNNNSGNNNSSSGNTNTGSISTGNTKEPENKEQPKEEIPKQEEPKEETKQPNNKEEEKEPIEEPEKTLDNKTNDKTTKKGKGKLTLKKKKMTLKKGQKSTIKITSKLNTKVTYKSLNQSIATVNKKGIVTAKKVGKATITVKANGKTKKVKVTVKGNVEKNNSIIKLGKNFKLSKTKAVLTKGSKMTIQVSSDISGNVKYRSLDKKIASVSVKGVIKAKKKGKTAIVIKTGKKTVKLNITVNR